MFSAGGFYFVLRGSDMLSRHIRTATNSLRSMGVVLDADAKKLHALQAQAQQHFGMAAKYAMVTMMLGRAIKATAKAYGDFAISLKRTQLTMGLSAAQSKELGDSFLNMAGRTEVGAIALSKGAKTLAQAGFGLKEIQAALPVMTDMMTVGEIKATEASDLMIQTLRGFNIPTEKLRETMDQMTYIAMKTPMDLRSMVQGMQYGTRGAAAFGISLQDMLITTGLIYPAVMKAGGSYQVFTRVMGRLAAPVGKAKDLMKKHGVVVYDSAGKMLKPLQMIHNLLSATDKMEEKDRNPFLNTILGFRGLTAAVLKNAVAFDDAGNAHRGILEAQKALEVGMKGSTGYLEKSANVLRDEWSMTVERATAVWEKFKIAIGPGVVLILTSLLGALEGAANAFTVLNDATEGV